MGWAPIPPAVDARAASLRFNVSAGVTTSSPPNGAAFRRPDYLYDATETMGTASMRVDMRGI